MIDDKTMIRKLSIRCENLRKRFIRAMEEISSIKEENANLRSALHDAEKAYDENARLRTQNAKLAGAAGELRQYICDMRNRACFTNQRGQTKITDYTDCYDCVEGEQAVATGYCLQVDATGKGGCPAKLRRCPHCAGSGVEG
ncbi:hypothetical protein [Maridesulfovibrio sp.]|uniref:hypothetical protein n=1 Tax=Maridesulfovibrio sp. TaxID=2795000 RepID=UPI0029CA7F26|nr:hypothetical protein [Maridesulfovibrio sp.]